MKAILTHPVGVACWLIIGMAFALYNRNNKSKPVPILDWIILIALGPLSIPVIYADKAVDYLNSIKI